MTFVEAAIEVLKREGKSLPVKRLAELAVKHNLLSVVGRDPEGTMQLRLADAVESHLDLVEVRSGVYGLRAYPPPPAAAEAPAEAPEAPAAGDEAGPAKRSRRGRRGRGKAAVAEALPAEAEPAEKAVAAVEEEKPAEEASAEGGKRRRRSRRGGRGRRRPDAPGDAQAESPPAEEVAPAEAAETPAEAAPAPAEEGPEEEGELLEEDEIDLPGGPLLAPTHGSEDMTRTDDERVVRAEIHGRREERGRHRRDRRDRPQGRPHTQHATLHTPAQGHVGAGTQTGTGTGTATQTQTGAGTQTGTGTQTAARRTVLDAVLELLRQNDGRPLHVRHLTEMAVKKQLLAGQPNELLRQVRAALVREVREREAEGLRARVRSFGGGQYALIDKKLDPELAQAERELAEKAARQRDATRTALRRRLGRMAPPAFEALGRVLLDKLGVTEVELVRRGEGVAYFGGVRALGTGALKTLVALRAGEGEIGRRAVGELRAGLAARGYDEGLLLGSGRLAPDGAAELKSGSGVVLHDGLSLSTLLIKHGLGVRRLHLPVDYLDLEFLGELTEG